MLPHSVFFPPVDRKFFTALCKGLVQAVFVIEGNSLRVVDWSENAEGLFGLSRDEVLCQSVERLYPDPSAFERVHGRTLSSLRATGFWRGEGEYRRRDRSVFTAEATQIWLSTEEGDYIIVLVRDLSESKERDEIVHWLNEELARRFDERASELIARGDELQRAETERRQTERLLDVLMRNITNNAILFLSADGYVIHSKGTEQLLGYVAEDLDGIHFSRLFKTTPEDQRRWSAMLDGAKRQSTVRDYDWVLRKDRSQLHVRVEIVALRDEAGALSGYIGFLRDDTEQKRIRDQLREKDHLASIGTATAMLAHEIRNPLNGMSTTVQYLERSLQNNFEPTKEMVIGTLHDLKTEIRRLQTLLAEFHVISQPQHMSSQAVELTELLRNVMPLAMPEFFSDAFNVVEELDPKLPLVRGDRDKLKQVFLNIAKNAFEAMPDGGTLTVRTYSRDETISIEITDTGTGIPDGLNVFDLFKSTKAHGTGLGLAIARQIVLAHGGAIEYSSRVGAGTTFRVTLPPMESTGVTPAKMSSAAQAAPESGRAGDPLRHAP
jgi:two-component system, sporulation sensor kinase E